jgi:hypothetical protein
MIDFLNFPIPFFLATLLVLWVATRIGTRYGNRIESMRDDFGIIQGASFTLLGLIVGFAFSMAVARYDQRKLFEENEANAIGTEFVRAELLPASDASIIKKLLREYTDQRILFYQTRDEEKRRSIDAATAQLQTKLWSSVKGPSLAQPTPVSALVVSGMNDVLNSQGYTQFSWWNRIPVEAWVLMGVIACCCCVMLGLYLRTGRTHRGLLIMFPVLIALSFFMIADIDAPRSGLIHVSPQNLISLLQSLNP